MSYELDKVTEELRQYRFKTKAMGVLLKYAQQHMPARKRGRLQTGILALSLHTYGEHPLTFSFDGVKVEEP